MTGSSAGIVPVRLFRAHPRCPWGGEQAPGMSLEHAPPLTPRFVAWQQTDGLSVRRGRSGGSSGAVACSPLDFCCSDMEEGPGSSSGTGVAPPGSLQACCGSSRGSGSHHDHGDQHRDRPQLLGVGERGRRGHTGQGRGMPPSTSLTPWPHSCECPGPSKLQILPRPRPRCGGMTGRMSCPIRKMLQHGTPPFQSPRSASDTCLGLSSTSPVPNVVQISLLKGKKKPS